MKREEKAGGFVRPVAFCGSTRLPAIPDKKNRYAKQSGFRPEPKAKGGDALGRMKRGKNKNKNTEICSGDETFEFAMRRDCSVTRDLVT
jgi:hypothetical protein